MSHPACNTVYLATLIQRQHNIKLFFFSFTVGRQLVLQVTVGVLPALVQGQLSVFRGHGQYFYVLLFLAVSGFDYVVGRVVREWTVQPDGGHERHQLVGGALVHAVALGQHVHVVEQLEQAGARLVDGAHDGAALVRETPQQLQAVRAGYVVQTTVEKRTTHAVNKTEGIKTVSQLLRRVSVRL